MLPESTRVISVDDHVVEPRHVWQTHLPARFRDAGPRIVEREDGAECWLMEGELYPVSLMGSPVTRNFKEGARKDDFARRYDDTIPAAYDPKPRLEAMDAMGVWAQICFQNGGVTQAGSLVALNDEQLAISIVQVYNDACADRMKESGGRINCMGTLPYWDKDVLNKEMRRIVDLGVKGIVLPDRPERLSEGYIGRDGKISPFWEELFDICNATGLPINPPLVEIGYKNDEALGWMFTEWMARGKPTVLGAASGAVAGLVAITPAAGFVGPVASIIIGAIAGFLCYNACNIKSRLGYDDSLDVVGVHGVGGTWGALATGLFATKLVNEAGGDGLFYGNPGQLWTQIVAVAATMALAVVGTAIILKVVDAIVGLRVSEEDEMAGLDLSQHSETAYTMGGGGYGETTGAGAAFAEAAAASARPRAAH
jgi:hypothetical protein